MKTFTLLVVTLLGLAVASMQAQTQSSTTASYVQTSKIVGVKVKDSSGQEVGVVRTSSSIATLAVWLTRFCPTAVLAHVLLAVRKLHPERPHLIGRAQLRLQRRNRPESAKHIGMVKAVPRPLQAPAARTKPRPNTLLANTAKPVATKEPAKVAARKRAKGISLN